MAISANLVKELRERTGLGMMDCKRALTEADGDEAAAIEALTRKAKGKLETRSARETGQGMIFSHDSDNSDQAQPAGDDIESTRARSHLRVIK